ncbi:MAG: HEAT repeat domain-containing protein, partial [Candidatus Omnitrophota bacterium]
MKKLLFPEPELELREMTHRPFLGLKWAVFGLFLGLILSSCSMGVGLVKKALPDLGGAPPAAEKAPLAPKEAKKYQELLKDPNIEIRLAAATVLIQHGDPAGGEVLREALKGEDARHRLNAFFALNKYPTQENIQAM